MRQGNDVGTQYRSGIYYYDDEQRDAAEASRDAFQQRAARAGYGAITTEILPAPEFYYAEDYHQQYLAKNPGGYCGLGGTGVSCPVGVAREGDRRQSLVARCDRSSDRRAPSRDRRGAGPSPSGRRGGRSRRGQDHPRAAGPARAGTVAPAAAAAGRPPVPSRNRIAAERGWTIGREIGWQIRFERRFCADTRLLVATEGILTARLQQDPLLSTFAPSSSTNSTNGAFTPISASRWPGRHGVPATICASS